MVAMLASGALRGMPEAEKRIALECITAHAMLINALCDFRLRDSEANKQALWAALETYNHWSREYRRSLSTEV